MFAFSGKVRFLAVSAAAFVFFGAVSAAEARRGKISWGSSSSKTQPSPPAVKATPVQPASGGPTIVIVPRPSNPQNAQQPTPAAAAAPAQAAPRAIAASQPLKAAAPAVAGGGEDEARKTQPLGAPLPVLGASNQMAEKLKPGFSQLN